jgi:hypothetical protein
MEVKKLDGNREKWRAAKRTIELSTREMGSRIISNIIMDSQSIRKTII